MSKLTKHSLRVKQWTALMLLVTSPVLMASCFSGLSTENFRTQTLALMSNLKASILVFFLLLGINGSFAQIKRQLYNEDDGFRWYCIGNGTNLGAQDGYGNTLIPLNRGYSFIMYYHPEDSPSGFFLITKDKKEGVCDIKGKEIIAPKYKSVIYMESSGFVGYLNGERAILGVALNEDGMACHLSSAPKKSVAKSNAQEHNGQQTNQTKRTYLPDGGYMDVTHNADGSITNVYHWKCNSCKGLKICSLCRGAGGRMVGVYNRYWSTCTYCGSSGRCPSCRGTGESVMVNTYRNGVSEGINPYSGKVYRSSKGSNTREEDGTRQSMHGTAGCPSCKGTGKCSMCNGKGWYENQHDNYNVYKCSLCSNTGRCQTCHGNGGINY